MRENLFAKHILLKLNNDNLVKLNNESILEGQLGVFVKNVLAIAEHQKKLVANHLGLRIVDLEPEFISLSELLKKQAMR